MPSVDPQRLEREIDRALSDPTGPAAVEAGLRDLFDFYSNRPRHSPSRAPLDESTRSYGVPAYVLEQVIARLKAIPLTEEMRAALIDELWSTGYSEQRRIAVALLTAGDPDVALETALEYAHDKTSTSQLETLAEGVIAPIREFAPDLHWRTIADLIKDDDGNPRLLGLSALEMACREPDFEIVPRVYECLQGISSDLQGRDARAFAKVIEAIAARYPLEVVRFLEDAISRNPLDRHTQRLLAKVRTGLAHEGGAGSS